MIKLIVTDMDGTFLNDNHEIDERFWDIFQIMKEKGIMFSVASGRQYYSLVNSFDSIKEDMVFIAENGTLVMYKNEEIFSNCLSRECVKKILKKIREIENIGVVFCGKKSAYIENDSPDFLNEVNKYYHRKEIVKNLDSVEEEIIKIAIYDFKDGETNSYKHLKDFTGELKVVLSGKHWVDLMNPDSNKGEAIKKIRELFNIEKDEIAAFGDYLNDLEMLEEVIHSYAMENAHPKIKNIAKYIAKNNNDRGVVEAILEILNKG